MRVLVFVGKRHGSQLQIIGGESLAHVTLFGVSMLSLVGGCASCDTEPTRWRHVANSVCALSVSRAITADAI
jgi:hypothetical protein